MTKKQIIEWARVNIDECGYGVDHSDMDTRCWRCGYERQTEMCHVIPKSLGGEDVPSNYRLLCHECHLEAPNVNDPNAMDQWIRDTNVGFYDYFWELKKMAVECYEHVLNDAIIHYGEKALNESSKKWVRDETLKRMIAKNNDILKPH